MSSLRPSEPESAPNSVSSTPRADPPPPPPARWHQDDAAAAAAEAATAAPRVRLMCSFGGRILPRPHDNQLRYVGGDTRIVAVHRSTTFSALHAKLAKLTAGSGGQDVVVVKYQLPNEDLDSLISVSNDEDIENMMEEFERLSPGAASAAAGRTPRLRLFLFPPAEDEGGFGSVLEGTVSKRDSWFLDALNGGRLERGRSEASSIVSEVPDYLFGLDINSEEPKPKSRMANENASDPGSPIPGTLSPKFRSTSSAASAAPIPVDLPPVKTRPDVPVVEPPVQQQAGYAGNPVWQYVQEPVPVYYMPGPVGASGIPLRQVPVPVQYYSQQTPVAGGQIPAGYGQPVAGGQIPAGYGQPVQGIWGNPPHAGPVYVGGPPVVRPPVAGGYDYAATAVAADASEKPAGGGLMRNPAAVYAMAGIPQAGGEATGPEAARIGRTSSEYLNN